MRQALAPAIWLVAAASAQIALSERIGLGFARPDFLLLCSIFLSLRREINGAAAVGFFAGFLHGAVLNASLGMLVASRTLTAVIASKLFSALIDPGPFTAALVVGACSLFAGILALFLGSPQNILGHLAATIGTAIYNAVLAVPVYWLTVRTARAGARG